MPAVTFNNTQNVGFIVANTAVPRRNLTVSIPPGDAGDTLVVMAVANTGTQTVSMNVAGYTVFINPAGASPSSGEIMVAYRISDGRETSLSVKTDSSSTDSNFCAAVLRLKNTHRISPLMGPAGSGSSPNTAVDGVQISTGEAVTKPIGDGSMLISLLAGGDGTSFLDGEQPATQTLITKANTANSRMMISYQMKPITNAYTTLAFANTAGRRRAVTFTVTPDTMAAGAKETFWGGGSSLLRTTGQILLPDSRLIHLARADEEIGEVGIRIGSASPGDGAGVEIGVYDVTNGYANSILLGAQTVNTLSTTATGSTTFVQTFYPPIKLTKDKRYGVGFRSNSTTSIGVTVAYLGTAQTRSSSQNGAVALASSWDYDSSGLDNWYDVFASVRNNRKAHISSYKFFSNTVSGTAHSAQFPLYPGASRKIILMGYAEGQAATMNVATFDGQPMTLINNDTSNDDFCIWYYDLPSSNTSGNKTITMTTPTATSITTWHAWQVTRAAAGAPRNTLTTVALGVGDNVSNTIVATENSMILATVASSSPARSFSWNFDVVTDRQELDETNQTTATADGFQYTAGPKTITATASGTEGNKYLGLVSIDTYKSSKIKSGFVP